MRSSGKRETELDHRKKNIMQTTAVSHPPDLLRIPQTPLALEILEYVTRSESASIRNHSIRSYLFARLTARERVLVEGRDYDAELLFCACALHDVGLTQAGDRGHRFEVDGADLAAELLTRRGLPTAKVDIVWQAIALNTSPGIVERRGAVCELTLAGVVVDFGGPSAFISDVTAGLIHDIYPRLSIGSALADAIVAQAGARPEKAPLFSMPAQLLRQRATTPHITEVEQMAQMGRWGE
jgi:hypothetical protein